MLCLRLPTRTTTNITTTVLNTVNFAFLNRNHPLVLGTNNSNLPRILQIFGDLFVNDVLSDDEAARKRVLAIIRQIQVSSHHAIYLVIGLCAREFHEVVVEEAKKPNQLSPHRKREQMM